MVGVGVKAREERGGGDAGELGERREVTSKLLGAPVSLGDRTGENSSQRSQPRSQVGGEHFLINHKAANRCGSPGAPLTRPTPTPEGGGGRNKARAPRRVPWAAEPERGRGSPGRGRPERGRREAAGLSLPSPARSLRRVPTAAARIPTPGLSFPRSKFTLFAVRAPLLEAQGNSATRGHGGAPVVPRALPPRLGLRARLGARARRLGTGRERRPGGPRLRLVPSPSLPSPAGGSREEGAVGQARAERATGSRGG